jgi:pyruvate dehydrogenase E1 component alpha subunit
VQRLRNWMASNHWMTAEEETAIDTAISTEIEAAVAFAEAGTLEPVADLERFVLMATVVQENADVQEDVQGDVQENADQQEASP